MGRRTTPEQRRQTPVPGRWLRIGGLFLTFAGLRFLTFTMPEERLWGINHPAFLPVWLALTLTLIAILFCTPLLLHLYHRVARFLFGTGMQRGRVRIIVLVAGAGFLFWFLRMETYFLGDGAVYIGEIYRLNHGEPVSEEMLLGTLSAPLTGRVIATLAPMLYNSTAPAGGILRDSRIVFWLTGPLLGMLFIALLLLMLKRLNLPPPKSAAILILFLAAPGSLFFFGYVEYYTFVYTFLAAYFFLAILSFERGLPVVYPLLALFLSVLFHFMALLALPSFVLLLLSRAGTERMRSRVRPRVVLGFLAFLLCAGAGWYFTSGTWAEGSRNIIAIRETGSFETLQRYTLFSWYHVADVVNLLILLAGPLSIGILFLRKRSIFAEPSALFGFMNVALFLFLALFGNASFGLARDWDINAILGLSVAVFAVPFVLRSGEDGRTLFIQYTTAGAVLCTALFWWTVNLSNDASVRRYASILELDADHIPCDGALNGYEHLRKWYYAEQDAEGTIMAIRRKIEYVGYPEDFRALTLTLQEFPLTAGRKELYDFLFDQLFRRIREMRDKNVDVSHAGRKEEFEELTIENALTCMYQDPSEGLGLEYARFQGDRLKEVSPGTPLAAILEGQIALETDGDAAPGPFLLGGRAVKTSGALCLYAGRALLQSGQFEEARRILEKGYRLDTTHTLPLYYLAIAESQLSDDYDKMERYLVRFLEDTRAREALRAGGAGEEALAFARELLDTVRNAR